MRIGKNVLLWAALSCFAASVSSCDFVRFLAGRPTSKDIEVKREQIAKLVEQEKSRQDSVLSEQRRRDSIDALEARALKSLHDARLIRTSVIDQDDLTCEYYVVVGAFSIKSNAQKLESQVRKTGYSTLLVKLANGLTAVAVGGTDSACAVKSTYESLAKENFCPANAWILQII